MVGYPNIDAVLGAIETALDGRAFIASDTFSAADCYVASCLSFYMRFGMVPQTPVFRGYVDRMEARPAYLRAGELDRPMPGPRPPDRVQPARKSPADRSAGPSGLWPRPIRCSVPRIAHEA